MTDEYLGLYLCAYTGDMKKKGRKDLENDNTSIYCTRPNNQIYLCVLTIILLGFLSPFSSYL